jgi:hypothetical protein
MEYLYLILVVVGGISAISLCAALILILASRNSPDPYTPEEDEAQSEYIRKYMESKRKK